MTGLGGAQAAFAALPAAVRGALWMSGSALLYACIYVIIRRLTETLPIAELVFLRGVMGMLMTAPWLLSVGLGGLRTSRMGLYGFRTAVVYIGQLAWFFALARLTLSDATALMFTLPLFTVLLAALVLGERVGLPHWLATAAGFVGALIIIRPGVIDPSLAAGAALFTAMSYAVGQIATKSLTRTEPTNAVVFYMFALMALVGAVPAALTWQTPVWSDVPWILAFGLLSTPAQQAVTRAFVAAPANVVVPFNFLKLPFVAAIGFVLYAETPDPWTWLGAAVIFSSTYYIGRRGARQARASA